jgi:hypothetical protein
MMSEDSIEDEEPSMTIEEIRADFTRELAIMDEWARTEDMTMIQHSGLGVRFGVNGVAEYPAWRKMWVEVHEQWSS